MAEKRILVENSKRVGIGLIAIIFVQMFMIITGNCDFITVSNAETFGDFEYTIDSEDNTVEITKYKGSETEVTIPDTIEGLKVTSIGWEAFSGCSSLTSVNVPDGVTNIKYRAFYGCSSLTSINIPEGVASIGSEAFEWCISLTNINIPKGVTSIGDDAFGCCFSLISINVVNENEHYKSENGVLLDKAQKILIKYPEGKKDIIKYKIPEGVTSIGTYAFMGCSSLTSIDIPEEVTSIGYGAFWDCSSLTSINIPKGVTSIRVSAFSECSRLISIEVVNENEHYKSENGILFDKNQNKLIKYPEGKKDITEYKIPEGVTSIGSDAFMKCSSLTSIDIPQGVTSIGSDAFMKCSSLTSIDIPEGVTSISDSAFYGCSSLTSINIPEGVTSISDSAFYGCSSLTSINIPEGVKSINRYAFYGCSSLASINIPEGVTSIEWSTFEGCSSLTSINIPEGVKSIGRDAFYGCSSLTSINIPEGVTSIGKYAFYRCSSLISINIPEEVTSIGEYAFSGCKLYISSKSNEIQLPETIKKAMKKDDILYSNNEFSLYNCSLNADRTMLLVDDNIGEGQVRLDIEDGALDGLSFIIDNDKPIIDNVSGNPTNWTNQDITLTVNAEDKLSGILVTNGYSFDGGKKWQTENTKTYSKNESGIIVKVKDKVGNIATYDTINITKIDKEGPKVTITTEKTEQINKLKVKLTANEAMKNIDELNLSNNSKVESYTLSEDEKELQIVYVNNTENDFKITEKFIVKDFLGNKTTVDLEPQNIVVPTKVFKMTYKTTYQETKKGENTYISNIPPNTTIAETINNLNTNGNITIYKNNEKITDNKLKIATGMKLKAEYDNKIYEYTIAINGDTNGDGESDIKDLLAVNKHRLGKALLKNEYETAGDVNKDGKVDIKDLLQINKFRLGKIKNL